MRFTTFIFLTITLTLSLSSCNYSNNPIKEVSKVDLRQGQSAAGGCAEGTLTYADVKGIFESSCTLCHQVGYSSGDWTSYENIIAKKEIITKKVQSGDMPPTGIPFNDQQKSDLLEWFSSGACEKIVEMQQLPEEPLDKISTDSTTLEQARPVSVPTEADQISYEEMKPILEKSCNGCHKEGGMAGFFGDWTKLENIQKKSSRIIVKVEDGSMPMVMQGYSEPLEDQEKKDLLEWLNNGAPLGKK